MNTRAAVQFEVNGPLEVVEVLLPEPSEDQVIVKLFSGGVCHSQLHQMHNPNSPRPLVLGHEGTGVVKKVGNNVDHVKEGDNVIVTWVRRNAFASSSLPMRGSTGITYNETPLNGGVYTLAEDVIVGSEYVVPISNEYPTDVSCIIGCAVLTGAGAVLYTANVRPGNSVAVFGVGGVGLCAIQTAAILEAYPIIAVDLSDEKLDLAKKFGATHGINASKDDPVKAIQEMTNGGVDYAFDAFGVKVTNEQILPATKPGGSGAYNQGGVAVLIGLPNTEDPMSLFPRNFVVGQRQYRGSLGASYPEVDFPMFLRWFNEGKFPLDQLITRRYKLDDVNEAYRALHDGEILGRAIIEY